ncbi:ASST-domain-containing protein [Aspergillus cavernicola]|uniref:ASST-domain-containing protein n=1 Tax=Aspergillus cavernicola TaxID=176166 RepID=A0ABR4HKG7_9EURO
MKLIKPTLLITTIIPSALAEWQYLSRPDLSPPRLNITVPATSVSPGYIFITPYSGFEDGSSGPDQPGAYIFRDDGDLIWSGLGYLGGAVANFGPAEIDNKPVLKAAQGLLDGSHGRGYANHAILDDHYETVKVLRAASHQVASIHEFQVIGGKTVLIETPVPVPFDLSSYGGDEDQRWILSSGFQEIDIQTGELLFEWYSLDHITPKHSALPLTPTGPFNGDTSKNAWDYFHLNSADKDRDGNYLISARNYAAIFKINGTTGEVIWQLGGPQGSDFEIPPETEFAFQHDARIQYRSDDDEGLIERISFFDNADHSQPGHSLDSISRARYIELNHTSKTARSIQTFSPPDPLIANSQGNTQFLPSGNVFVNWGQAGAITEFSEKGDVLFHAYLDSYPNSHVQSYRGFRFPWTGYSGEEPAVVALGGLTGLVSIYVSWNGDTETASWEFYLVEGGAGGGRRYLGTKPRTSFETSFHAHLDSSAVGNRNQVFVAAEARDANGRVLGRSRVASLADREPYTSLQLVSQGWSELRSEYDQQRLEL